MLVHLLKTRWSGYTEHTAATVECATLQCSMCSFVPNTTLARISGWRRCNPPPMGPMLPIQQCLNPQSTILNPQVQNYPDFSDLKRI